MSTAAATASGYTIEEIWQLLGQLGGTSDDDVLVDGQALAFLVEYRVDLLMAVPATSISAPDLSSAAGHSCDARSASSAERCGL